MDISIKGIQKASLIDYPGKIASIVFLGTCNFRCHFCHNPELVLGETKEEVNINEFLDFLDKKRKWIDGVCITGGEPTLHEGVVDFIRELKKRGLSVKLDTNGTNPLMIEELIKENLVDYLAMDIKASKEGYEKATGTKVNMDAIEKSIQLVMNSGIEYEFRTTVVPGLFDENEAEKIGQWLQGAKKLCLQQFRNSDRVLDPDFQNVRHYHVDKLENFKKILSKYVDKVDIRGV